MADLQNIFDRINAGETTFDEELLPVVYDALRALDRIGHAARSSAAIFDYNCAGGNAWGHSILSRQSGGT